VFREASFLEGSLIERFDPEGFEERPKGEWGSNAASGALEISARQRITDGDFALFSLEN
jgi:hypothetical protein